MQVLEHLNNSFFIIIIIIKSDFIFDYLDWTLVPHRLYRKLCLDKNIDIDNAITPDTVQAVNHILKKAILHVHAYRMSRLNPSKVLELLAVTFGMENEVGSSWFSRIANRQSLIEEDKSSSTDIDTDFNGIS